MQRKYNFCAGPAAMPEAVLRQAQEELLDWQGQGLSVMEMSHRSAEFVAIAAQAEEHLRALLAVPDNYAVLFLQGGATQQFASVPMNILGDRDTADYVNTGQWSKKAIKEAGKFCQVNVVADAADNNYTSIPDFDTWQLSADAAYLHYTPNETIGGVEFHWVPEVEVPLVADMSSTILSRPIDVSRFGVIYAGAQKNIGPAGLTVVIVREDLLGKAHALLPSVMNYQVMAEAQSMSNTPPTLAWYLAGLVFKWLLDRGGLEVQARENQAKAEALYTVIDNSAFYACPVARHSRSWMNVPFTLADSELDKVFLSQAEAAGLLNLKGHRSVGGMRASLYNAVTQEAVNALISFMGEFERQHS